MPPFRLVHAWMERERVLSKRSEKMGTRESPDKPHRKFFRLQGGNDVENRDGQRKRVRML